MVVPKNAWSRSSVASSAHDPCGDIACRARDRQQELVAVAISGRQSVRQTTRDHAGSLVSDEDLDRPVTLQRPDGGHIDRAGDILLHLNVHQIHHRGQAHAMLSGTQVKPPQLDEYFLIEERVLAEGELRAQGISPARLLTRSRRGARHGGALVRQDPHAVFLDELVHSSLTDPRLSSPMLTPPADSVPRPRAASLARAVALSVSKTRAPELRGVARCDACERSSSFAGLASDSASMRLHRARRRAHPRTAEAGVGPGRWCWTRKNCRTPLAKLGRAPGPESSIAIDAHWFSTDVHTTIDPPVGRVLFALASRLVSTTCSLVRRRGFRGRRRCLQLVGHAGRHREAQHRRGGASSDRPAAARRRGHDDDAAVDGDTAGSEQRWRLAAVLRLLVTPDRCGRT